MSGRIFSTIDPFITACDIEGLHSFDKGCYLGEELQGDPNLFYLSHMKKINASDYRADKSFKISGSDTYEDCGLSDKKLDKRLLKVRRQLGDFQDKMLKNIIFMFEIVIDSLWCCKFSL